MAFSVHNDVLDAALSYIKNNCTRLTICSAQPTSFNEANNEDGDTPAGYKLAAHTVDSDDFTGPADGDTSGRKLTINQQTGVTACDTGTATHMAMLDVDDSKLLYVKELASSVSMTDTETYTLVASDIEIRDPQAES